MSNCPICGSHKIKDLIEWKKFTILKCFACKLIFSSPLPSDEELRSFYQGFMFNKPEDHEINNQIKKRKKELQRLFDLSLDKDEHSQKTFLDYGGGTGVVYKTASDMNLNSYYFDLDEEAKKFSKEKFDIINEKIVENLTDSKMKFDYIFSDNVIEHVRKPQEFTLNLIKCLKTGGRLVIKSPNASNSELLFNPVISIKGYLLNALKYNSILKSLNGYLTRFWCCDPPRHLYSFSKKSLEELMAQIENKHLRYKVSFYEVPWYENTVTKLFFSKDKNFKPLASLGIRLVCLPIILIEFILQITRKILLKFRVLSPAGIILTIDKTN